MNEINNATHVGTDLTSRTLLVVDKQGDDLIVIVYSDGDVIIRTSSGEVSSEAWLGKAQAAQVIDWLTEVMSDVI